MNTVIDYNDYVYTDVPDLSPQARAELTQIRKIKGDTERSKQTRSWKQEHIAEILQREEIQEKNVSNFMCIADRLRPDTRDIIRPMLEEYSKHRGYYYQHEDNGYWLKKHQRTDKPESKHILCRFEEALEWMEKEVV